MLDSHSEMAVPDETGFVLGLGVRRAHYERPEGFLAEAFLDDLLPRAAFRRLELGADAMRSRFSASSPASFADAIRLVFAMYAQHRGKTRYGDKTPFYVLHLALLAEIFPEARFVHVIRDGRDVALSYLDVDWGPETLEEAAVLWKRAVRRGRAAGERIGAGRYREIRYEQLVAEPEATVRQLCDFLDLRFEPAMLRYYERANEIAAPMARPQARQGLYRPPTKGMRDWRSQMAEDDVARFELLAGDVLGELGYELGAPRVGPRLRLETKARWLGVQAGRVAHRGDRLRKRLVMVPFRDRGRSAGDDGDTD